MVNRDPCLGKFFHASDFLQFLMAVFPDFDMKNGEKNGHDRTQEIEKTIRQVGSGSHTQHTGVVSAAGVPRHQWAGGEVRDFRATKLHFGYVSMF